MTGTVESVRTTYGFIKGDNGESYFLLPTALVAEGPQFSQLHQGQAVEFEPYLHDKGWRASKVRVTSNGR